MKKVFSLIIALALIFAALFSLSSCFYVNSSEPNYVNYRKYDNAENTWQAASPIHQAE